MREPCSGYRLHAGMAAGRGFIFDAGMMGFLLFGSLITKDKVILNSAVFFNSGN